jgi:hypothetical protein
MWGVVFTACVVFLFFSFPVEAMLKRYEEGRRAGYKGGGVFAQVLMSVEGNCKANHNTIIGMLGGPVNARL